MIDIAGLQVLDLCQDAARNNFDPVSGHAGLCWPGQNLRIEKLLVSHIGPS
jgi:hypothetical protein